MKNIPLFNLSRRNKKYKEKILLSWEKIFDKNEFTSGIETDLFEKEFAKLCNTKYALAVQSGTDSLILSLLAAGITTGDEVITTPCTFSATADAIIHVGAKPIFVDVESKTGNIDPKEITTHITKKTKAILLVHLYGVPCEMDEITKIAKENKLIVIEDASHAHGSLYKGKPVGSFGMAGCFSLYPSKSLGALGNAGIISSNNKSFIKKARMFANHGIKNKETKYTHHLNGFNKLINNLQSTALLYKIKDLQNIITTKLEIAQKYQIALQNVGEKNMFWPTYTKPSLYVYAFQTKKRSAMKKYFSDLGIETGIYYPTPIHLQPSMKFLDYKKGDLPNAENFFKRTLSIPLFSELTEQEISSIVTAISLIKK